MAELIPDIREIVRNRYAAAAKAAATGDYEKAAAYETEASCCDPDGCSTGVWGSHLYEQADRDSASDAAVGASLGCGVPTAVADLHDGDVVLDLGSGAGADVLISARRVAPTGRAIGLDMTDEMLELARSNAKAADVENVEFVKGYLEEMPLANETVDVIISNCVINLSGDKSQVLREAARVLKPGGRFAVSDVIADPDMEEATRQDMQAYTGCISGALTHHQFTDALHAAGLTNVSITETHRVHQRAASAIIRATKPIASADTTTAAAGATATDGCCAASTRSTCCEPSAKAGCCDPGNHAAGTCGCQTET